MKAAFGKLVIIRLRNGKVTVEVDTTQTDLEIYNPAWDTTAVEVVMPIDYLLYKTVNHFISVYLTLCLGNKNLWLFVHCTTLILI